jgi:hypothetical protein
MARTIMVDVYQVGLLQRGLADSEALSRPSRDDELALREEQAREQAEMAALAERVSAARSIA